ncbi:MAG TPA: NfeD family protein [Clostridiales bacterium]|nr:NfeD family protein [Clostridiales bacterium]
MQKPLIFPLSLLLLLLLTTPLLAATTAASGGALVSFAEAVRLPVVSGLLFAIGLSFILIELMAPGFGFFGIAGLSAFFLYFAAHLLANSHGWLALIIFGIGMLFIMLEALVVTGFAFSGIFGLLAVLGSVIMLAPSLAEGALTASISVVFTILIMVVSIHFMKKKSFIRRFVLSDRTDTQSGYTPPNMDNEKYLGREGYTLTQLRPAGTMKIDGGRVDVVSDGGYVDAGVKVRVVGLDGTRILVREVEEA